MHYRYELDKSSKKFSCPGCNQKSFVKFKDESGNYLDDSYGRCDRENNCNYFIKPPVDVDVKQEKQKKVVHLSREKVMTLINDQSSNFHEYFKNLLNIPESHFKRWGVGTERSATTFAIVDRNKNILNVKRIPFAENGHRDKSSNIPAWYESTKQLNEDEEFTKCFFGESIFDKTKPSCLVESEKSAFIGSFIWPQFNWLATGGNSGTLFKHFSLFFNYDEPIYYLGDNDKAGRENKTIKNLNAIKDVNPKKEIYIIIDENLGESEDFVDVIDRGEKYDLLQVIEDHKKEVLNVFDQYLESHRFDPTKEPPAESPILFHNDSPIGHRGANIITVTGKAKSRKTVVTSAIASGLVSDGFLGFNSRMNDKDRIVHIDTEQGYFHYYNSVTRIFKQVNVKMPKNFQSFTTRDAEHEFRLELLDYIFEELKPTVLIVDGITDFVYDINDQKEAKQIGDKFLIQSAKHDTLVIAVIHTTKSTGMMTGAIGTYLEKKCETSIKVELDEEDRLVSHITCQYSRNKPFEDFSITMNDTTGFYEILGDEYVKVKGSLDLPYNRKSMESIIEIAFKDKKLVPIQMMRNIVGNKASDSGALKEEAITTWIKDASIDQLIVYTPQGYLQFQTKAELDGIDDLPF